MSNTTPAEYRAACLVQLVTGAAYVVALREVKRRDELGELRDYLRRVDALREETGDAARSHRTGGTLRCVRCLRFLVDDNGQLTHEGEAHGIPAGRCT